LEVDPGQTVAIVGPTGAGKTTLVNLLMRFYEVTGGRIFGGRGGHRVDEREDLRAKTAWVLQDAWLFGGTIAETSHTGRSTRRRNKSYRQQKRTHVDRFVRTLPDGYDTVINEEGDNVSAGEKQLITIARAFLAEPAILILDEGHQLGRHQDRGTDPACDELAAHRPDQLCHRASAVTIRDADLILVMESGQIVEQGTHDELLAADGALCAALRGRSSRRRS